MSTVHRTLIGDWAECSDPACGLKFHIPDLTVAEVEAIPLVTLLPLLEVIDPPTRVNLRGDKYWSIPDKDSPIPLTHREYDLPAVVWADGSLEWALNGQFHRPPGRPARIYKDGTCYWWVNGVEVAPPSGP
jgi:hypothetical protein